ncbi:MAG: uL22 family ribosomal protein [Nanoarchaeota archaeon]
MEDKKENNTEEKEKIAGAVENKAEQQREDKKKADKKIEIKKKSEAVARSKDLNISTKQASAICNFIRGKSIEKAAEGLEQVAKLKMAIRMKGELPHRKGKGMERGRYPMKASLVFIKILKSLAANSSVNGLENPYIATAKADIASRPFKRFGSKRFKRTHVYLIAKEKASKIEDKK